jgi:hypothetical protein
MSTHRRKKWVPRLAVFWFLMTTSVLAQDSSTTQGDLSIPKSWLRVGAGGTRELFLIGGGVFFRLDGPMAVGIRGGMALEIELFRQPSEALWEITPSLAYVPFTSSVGMIALVVGAGMAGGTVRGEFIERRGLFVEEYERRMFRSISFTVEVQAAFFVIRGLGLSGAIFTNVNGERNLTGYHIGLQFTYP